MENRVVLFKNINQGYEIELEVPINITANDLIYALNEAFDLGIYEGDVLNNYLSSENPIAFLKGNRTLNEFGIRNGSIIIYKRR